MNQSDPTYEEMLKMEQTEQKPSKKERIAGATVFILLIALVLIVAVWFIKLLMIGFS